VYVSQGRYLGNRCIFGALKRDYLKKKILGKVLNLIMGDTNENPGPSGDSGNTLENFELGLELQSRFVTVTELETSTFVQNNRNKNTAQKTEGNTKIMYNWLSEICKETRKMHEIPPTELNMYLARFFLSIRRPDGSEYEPDKIRGYLGSFSRHLRDNGYEIWDKGTENERQSP
jgi:hypothetical protein